jgi:hypothetical protein
MVTVSRVAVAGIIALHFANVNTALQTRQKDRWMDRRKDSWMDRHADGEKDRQEDKEKVD